MRRPSSVVRRAAVAAVAAAALVGARDTAAALPGRLLESYVVDRWPSDELPSHVVRQFAQDRDGRLWMATQDGLVQFDGVRFVTSGRGDGGDRFSDSNVAAVIAARDGAVWAAAGSGGGLLRFAAGTFRRFGPAEGVTGDVRALLDTADGIWVGTSDGLLRQTREGGFARLPAATPALTPVWSLARAPDGALWVGTGAGLAKVAGAGAGATLVAEDVPAGLRGAVVRAVVAEPGGDLWAATRGAGLWQRQGRVWRRLGTAEGLASDDLGSLLRDRDGTLWVGSMDAGVDRVVGGRVLPRAASDARLPRAVRALFQDREGGVWIGTRGEGPLRLEDRPFTLVDRGGGLAADDLTAVTEDAAGALWIGSRGGLIRRAPDGRSYPIGGLPGHPRPAIQSVAVRPDGVVFAVALGVGLARVVGGDLAPVAAPPALDPASFRRVVADRAGRLWITGRVLASHDERRPADPWRIHGAGVVVNPTALQPTARGTLWVASGDGAFELDAEGAVLRRIPLPGVWDSVTSLLEDGDGTLWISSYAAGLRRLSGGRLGAITARSGLPSDRLLTVLDDGDGLWIACTAGLLRARKSELAAVAEGHADVVAPVWVGRREGIELRDLDKAQPIAWRASDGAAWFATAHGLARVPSVAAVTAGASPPPLLITEVRAGDRVVTDRPLRIRAGAGAVQVSYAAVVLGGADKVRYRHRLRGLQDATWVDAGAARAATFERLPPGAYTFEVVARDRRGAWSAPATLAIQVLPRWYESRWFVAFAAVAIGFAGLAGHRARVGIVRARFHAVLDERARLARDIHDGLAQGLVAIAAQLDCARDTLAARPELARRYVLRACDATAMALREARRSVWALRPAQLDGADLAEALRSFAERSAADVPIAVDVRGEPRRLPADREAHLLLIAQEGVSNALRHARARTVRVELAFEPGRVALAIVDDGCGFAPGAAEDGGHGHGLASLRHRARELGGELHVESAAGAGTTVRVEVRT